MSCNRGMIVNWDKSIGKWLEIIVFILLGAGTGLLCIAASTNIMPMVLSAYLVPIIIVLIIYAFRGSVVYVYCATFTIPLGLTLLGVFGNVPTLATNYAENFLIMFALMTCVMLPYLVRTAVAREKEENKKRKSEILEEASKMG